MGMNPRLLRPRATGFTPKNVSGLAAWWDANDTSTLTLDGNGNVSSWADKSGNAVTASQGTANNRPTPTAAALNGKQVLTFDGSNDSLAFTGTARTDETYILVARANQTPGGVKTSQILGDASSGFGLTAVVKNDGSSTSPVEAPLGGFVAGTTLARWSPAANTDIGPFVFSVVRSSASGGQLFSSGVSRATCTTSNSFALARIGIVGSSFPLLGYIAEVCIYSRALSASERQQVERYLGNKWGLTVA